MDDRAIMPPSGLRGRLGRHAPLKTTGENWGRRGGFYGESDSSTRIYRCVLLYIEQGLGGETALFEAIARLLDRVQPYGYSYNLLPLGYGDGEALVHDRRAIPVRFKIIPSQKNAFLETCAKVAGGAAVDDPVVPSLFPKTDLRSLYTGKVAVDRNDLLIFVRRAGRLVFSEQATAKARRYRRQILDVAVGIDGVEWTYPLNDITNP